MSSRRRRAKCAKCCRSSLGRLIGWTAECGDAMRNDFSRDEEGTTMSTCGSATLGVLAFVDVLIVGSLGIASPRVQ